MNLSRRQLMLYLHIDKKKGDQEMYKRKNPGFWKSFFYDNKGKILFLILLSFVSIAINLVPPMLIRWYIDSVLVTQHNKILLAVGIIVGSLFAIELVKVIFNFQYAKFLVKMLNQVKSNLFSTMMNTNYLEYRKIISNNLNIYIKDVNSLLDGGFNKVPGMIISVFIAIGASIYILKLNLWFFLGTFLISIISLLPLNYINKRQTNLVAEAHYYEQEQTKYIKKFFDKPLFIKTNYRIGYIINNLENIAQTLRRAILKRELNFRFFLISRIISGSLLPTFIYGYGGYLFFQGKISIGEIIAIISMVKLITDPITNIGSYFLIIKDIIPRVKRINSALKLPTEFDFEHNRVLPNDSNVVIKFSNVTLELEGKVILEDVNFELRDKENTLIKGVSGAGKTTIFNLLLAILESTSGMITVNDIPYSNISKQEIRSLFAISPQELFFFSGTIRENLKILNQTVSDEEIKQALYLSCCDSFIKELPDGLDTVLEENASNLSGGQRQRLSLARVFLTKRKFLLLDEVTSSLNPELEKRILHRLYNQSDFTIIQISHGSVGDEYCIQKLVLENGKVTVQKNQKNILTKTII